VKGKPAGYPGRDTAVAASACGIALSLTTAIPHDLVDRIVRAVTGRTKAPAGPTPAKARRRR